MGILANVIIKLTIKIPNSDMLQAKTSSTKLPEVHGVQKELDPNLRPEKQHAISKQGKLERPQVGQGRAGLRRRKLIPSIRLQINL